MPVDPRQYTAVLLAGGRGTRLRSVLGGLPKVLASVGSRPFITYLFGQLTEAGFEKALLCLGFQAEEIQEALGSSYHGLQLEYSVEPEALGTGGALRYALPKIETENILAFNGDSYLEGALEQLDPQSEEGIAAIRLEDVSRYGSLEWDALSGRILRFAEKTGKAQSGWVNAGVYALKRSTAERISGFRPVSLEEEIFPALVREQRLRAFPLSGKFLDIGTPESLAQAEAFFSEGVRR